MSIHVALSIYLMKVLFENIVKIIFAKKEGASKFFSKNLLVIFFSYFCLIHKILYSSTCRVDDYSKKEFYEYYFIEKWKFNHSNIFYFAKTLLLILLWLIQYIDVLKSKVAIGIFLKNLWHIVKKEMWLITLFFVITCKYFFNKLGSHDT